MNTHIKTITLITLLAITTATATQAHTVTVKHTPYTDEQVIVATVGCAVLFGALAAMTSGISTAVGAIAGGSVCAVGFGEDYIKHDGRIVGYESGA